MKPAPPIVFDVKAFRAGFLTRLIAALEYKYYQYDRFNLEYEKARFFGFESQLWNHENIEYHWEKREWDLSTIRIFIIN